MATLRVWNPWNMLANIWDDFDVNMRPSALFPNIDLYEEGDKLVVDAELPGFEPKDVEVVLVDEYTLRISGRQKVKKTESSKKRKYYIQEKVEKAFSRTISLPAEVDTKAKITAEFENGVLKIELPKKKTTKALKVPIKVIKKK